MPNALAHLGVQSLATRALIRDADLRWVFLGCVIPDIPWVAQRVAQTVAPWIDPYELRLYAVVQSSLLCCLLLAGALATVSIAPRRIFGILALGSVLHLILDALQTKWANGVHLFAPFSWKLWNAGLFWPESTTTYLLTAWGLVYGVYAVWIMARKPVAPIGLRFRLDSGLALASLLLLCYCVLPVALRSGPEAAGNHYVSTLRNRDERAGREIELDRASGRPNALRSFAREELALAEPASPSFGTISIRGRFTDSDTIRVLEFHQHSRFFRDSANYLGLSVVALTWLLARFRSASARG